MAREGGTYYLFSTGDPAGAIGNGNVQIRTSANLRTWTYAGTVFAGSSFGSNNSVIGLATTPTPDPRSPKYHWTDDGRVFRTTSSDDFNAIDPSLVTAADGGKWLALGSFWSGIKLVKLDAATGKPAASPTVYSPTAKPSPDAEEGAGITYHDGFYYLLVSVDNCCRGISSTYHIQVGRSTSITGPYLDAAGTDMMNGGGMEVQDLGGRLAGDRPGPGPGAGEAGPPGN